MYTLGAMAKKQTKTLKIDAELHHQLKMRAAETKRTINAIVEAALRLFLAQPS